MEIILLLIVIAVVMYLIIISCDDMVNGWWGWSKEKDIAFDDGMERLGNLKSLYEQIDKNDLVKRREALDRCHDVYDNLPNFFEKD